MNPFEDLSLVGYLSLFLDSRTALSVSHTCRGWRRMVWEARTKGRPKDLFTRLALVRGKSPSEGITTEKAEEGSLRRYIILSDASYTRDEALSNFARHLPPGPTDTEDKESIRLPMTVDYGAMMVVPILSLGGPYRLLRESDLSMEVMAFSLALYRKYNLRWVISYLRSHPSDLRRGECAYRLGLFVEESPAELRLMRQIRSDPIFREEVAEVYDLLIRDPYLPTEVAKVYIRTHILEWSEWGVRSMIEASLRFLDAGEIKSNRVTIFEALVRSRQREVISWWYDQFIGDHLTEFTASELDYLQILSLESTYGKAAEEIGRIVDLRHQEEVLWSDPPQSPVSWTHESWESLSDDSADVIEAEKRLTKEADAYSLTVFHDRIRPSALVYMSPTGGRAIGSSEARMRGGRLSLALQSNLSYWYDSRGERLFPKYLRRIIHLAKEPQTYGCKFSRQMMEWAQKKGLYA